MRRWLRYVLLLFLVLVALLAATGFLLRSFIGGSQKEKLVAALSEKMGAPVSVANVTLDLGQWFRLRPAMALEDVAVGNPPGFRGKDLFHARRISAQVSLGALLRRNIDARSIRIEEPVILVETNARGLTNVGELLKRVSASPAAAPGAPGSGSSGMKLAIDELSLQSGTLTLAGPHAIDVRNIDITLRDVSRDRRCRLEASARLFGPNSTLKLAARAGPFGPDSLPLDGTLSIHLAPSEIPAALRREQFGSLLAAPGSKSSIRLEATVRGDLYTTLSGPAKLVFADLQAGKDEGHLLPVSGEADSAVTIADILATPQWTIDVPNARLRLGKGEWTGGARLQAHGGVATGNSRGSIRNVDINQLAGSFTAAHDKLYGLLEIPSYNLQFSGRNADQMRESLRGSGRLRVTQGRLAALDMLATIEHALGQAQQDTAASKGATPFHSMTADLNIAQQRMDVADLVLDGPTLKATGGGVIGFDQTLNFNLTARVGGTAAHLFNTLALRSAAGEADVPLTVTGTVESPRVRPSIRKLAGSTVQGLVDSFLNRGKKK